MLSVRKGTTKRCCYGVCKSDTRYKSFKENKYYFINFPKPCLPYRKKIIQSSGKIHIKTCSKCAKCELWVNKCGRSDKGFRSIDNVTKDTYICSLHFYGESGPTEKYPDPISRQEFQQIEKSIDKATSQIYSNQSSSSFSVKNRTDKFVNIASKNVNTDSRSLFCDITILPIMTKKRKLSSSSPFKLEKIEVKEENVGGNEYLMAKGRLKGVLKQLTEQSDSDDGDSSDDNRRSRSKNYREKKRKAEMPTPYHHTYVMKLFDRSVDLARFEEETPLYPICRAWMQNQPRNPQPIIKRRYSSPEPGAAPWNENNIGSEVHCLPPPSEPFVSRVPSPLPEQIQNKDNINLNYDETGGPAEKNVLIRNHLERWVNVKKKWIQTAAKNEGRYKISMCILQGVYNKSLENVE